MEKIFQNHISQADDIYYLVRDDNRFSVQKTFIENLWKVYQPYADPDFLGHFPNEFHQRFWEMFLTCKCLEMDLPVSTKNTAEGPDILINFSDKKVWIDAIVPTSGEPGNQNTVPEYTWNKAVTVPEEKVILRLINAVTTKSQKFSTYINKGIIGDNDVCVIAINGGQIRHSYFEDEVPYIAKAVFPFGNPYITIDTEFMSKVDEGYKHQPSVKKASGSSVSKEIFFNPNFSFISAIIYSVIDFYSGIHSIYPFRVIHNPLAKNSFESIKFLGYHYTYNLKTNQLNRRKIVE